VSQRKIKTGPSEGERVAVTEGLKVGELIVTDGADKLREGGKVELPGEAAPAPANAPADGQKQWNRGQGRKRDQGTSSGGDSGKPSGG
jgi:multidrug efflux system membrane fusion protein